MNGPTKTTLALVFARDEGCCSLCGSAITGERGRDWSLHHRRPRGSGGTSLAWVNLPANLVMLCGSGTTGCHGKVESRRDYYRVLGFLVPINGILTASDVPMNHAVHGHVYLTDDGTVTAFHELRVVAR